MGGFRGILGEFGGISDGLWVVLEGFWGILGRFGAILRVLAGSGHPEGFAGGCQGCSHPDPFSPSQLTQLESKLQNILEAEELMRKML